MRRLCLLTLVLAVATPGFAQQAHPAAVSIDSAAAVDTALNPSGVPTTGTVLDAIVSVGLGGGFEAIVRPWAQRLGTTRDWNPQVWLATLRYQHPGPVALRVDSGLIASPVGLADMQLRAPLNPTIGLPASLFTALPAFEPNGPRTTLLGALYPYGVSATASTARWDARVAAIDTTPLRMRMVFADTNPPRFANLVVGGGITPIIGLRIGASVTHGGWQSAGSRGASGYDVAEEDEAEHDEANEYASTPAPDQARCAATVVTIESQYAFRFTSISGEWVRDVIATSSGHTVTPSGWFVQGQQTLTPRWFAAGRIDRLSSPALLPSNTFEQQRFSGVEETIGYRLTPEVTVRAGHRAQRGFGRDALSHAATVSLVWTRRWM
jgi:hypothetical protein